MKDIYMKISNILNDNSKTIIVAIIALIILLPLGYNIVRSVFSQSAQPFLEKPDKKYKDCVKEITYMRFNHWHLLKDIRDEVMREGRKKGEIRISNCGKCHTSKERFCDKCHNAVNLDLDCFVCHPYPKQLK